MRDREPVHLGKFLIVFISRTTSSPDYFGRKHSFIWSNYSLVSTDASLRRRVWRTLYGIYCLFSGHFLVISKLSCGLRDQLLLKSGGGAGGENALYAKIFPDTNLITFMFFGYPFNRLRQSGPAFKLHKTETWGFKVLKKGQSKFDCLVFEMLYIKRLKPNLNVQADSIRAKLFV